MPALGDPQQLSTAKARLRIALVRSSAFTRVLKKRSNSSFSGEERFLGPTSRKAGSALGVAAKGTFSAAC